MPTNQPDPRQPTTTETEAHSTRYRGAPVEETETEAHRYKVGGPAEATETEAHYDRFVGPAHRANGEVGATGCQQLCPHHRFGGKLMNSFSRISRTRTVLTIISVTVAALACGSASASAKSWYLSVRPAHITQGGSVVIKTTAGRRCSLIIRMGGRNYRFGLPRGGERITTGQTAALGRARVTVYCRGLVATGWFSIAQRPSQPEPPAPTPPSTSTPAPPVTPPTKTNTPPATTTTPTAPAPQTPITVANVCQLNPGLGRMYTTTTNGNPTAYWTDGSKVTILAFSDDGNSSVDIAAVVGPDGQSIAYFARCDWSNWLDVAQYEAAQSQAGVPPAQSSSLGYLIQEQTDDAAASEADVWFKPSAGIQMCLTNPYGTCDYEPIDS
jgi:hypothetical protein